VFQEVVEQGPFVSARASSSSGSQSRASVRIVRRAI
jgi:hypothetical protein